jgi:hypothetical protein
MRSNNKPTCREGAFGVVAKKRFISRSGKGRASNRFFYAGMPLRWLLLPGIPLFDEQNIYGYKFEKGKT